MAGSSNDATEEPTPRRLAEARRRGEIAYSRELASSAGLVAVVVVLASGAPAALAGWIDWSRGALADAVAGGAPGAVAAGAGTMAWRLLGPALAAALLVGVGMGLAQTGGLVLAPVRMDLSRLASASSWRRLFDGRAALAVGQALLKVTLVGVIAWLTVGPVVAGIGGLAGASAGRLLGVLGVLTERLAVRLALAAFAFGVVDYLTIARRHRRQLRMTRDQVRREYREAEGDPAARGERQRLHRELSEQRMIDDVRKADFVVVNPDHIAVALRYDANGDAAPVVVAKGERLVAERIKQIAREAGVPIFRDVSLARALAELGEGGEIPGQLYEAVAEILRVVQGQGQGIPDPAAGSTVSGGATSVTADPPPIARGSSWKRV